MSGNEQFLFTNPSPFHNSSSLLGDVREVDVVDVEDGPIALEAVTSLQSNLELTSMLSNIHPHIVMKVSSSEPRDALQLERTCLTFIRFACTLFFTAIGIALNFRFDTSSASDNNDSDDIIPKQSIYSKVISFILIGLSLAVLIVSGISYFITINRYAEHKIKNYGFNNFTSMICISSVVLTLMGISISLLVEGYLEDEK